MDTSLELGLEPLGVEDEENGDEEEKEEEEIVVVVEVEEMEDVEVGETVEAVAVEEKAEGEDQYEAAEPPSSSHEFLASPTRGRGMRVDSGFEARYLSTCTRLSGDSPVKDAYDAAIAVADSLLFDSHAAAAVATTAAGASSANDDDDDAQFLRRFAASAALSSAANVDDDDDEQYRNLASAASDDGNDDGDERYLRRVAVVSAAAAAAALQDDAGDRTLDVYDVDASALYVHDHHDDDEYPAAALHAGDTYDTNDEEQYARQVAVLEERLG